MRVLLQNDTAGHYRALGDQVNMTFKLEVQTNLPQTAGSSPRFINKNYVKYKVSASIVISWGLSFKLEFFIEVKNRSVYHVRDNVVSELFMINACSPGKLKM